MFLEQQISILKWFLKDHVTLGTFTCTRFLSFRLKDSVDCLHETLSNPIRCLHVPALSIGMTLWHAHISLCPVCRLLHLSTLSSYVHYFYVNCCSLNQATAWIWRHSTAGRYEEKTSTGCWPLWWLCISKEHLISTPPSEQKHVDEGP